MANWLLLHYKIHPEPSAPRVYIWRKLKRIGAVLFQDTVWVLPLTPRTHENLQWLTNEIIELGGEATLWTGQLVLGGQDQDLVRVFVDQANQVYAQILSKLAEPDADFEALSRQYQQIKLRDYFNSELGVRIRDALLAVRGENL